MEKIERMPDAEQAVPARELALRVAMIAFLVGASFLMVMLLA